MKKNLKENDFNQQEIEHTDKGELTNLLSKGMQVASLIHYIVTDASEGLNYNEEKRFTTDIRNILAQYDIDANSYEEDLVGLDNQQLTSLEKELKDYLKDSGFPLPTSEESTNLTEGEDAIDVINKPEDFYFTSSSKDIVCIKGMKHAEAQDLAVALMLKFRPTFQLKLDELDLSDSFILTLEFKAPEEMPNAENSNS